MSAPNLIELARDELGGFVEGEFGVNQDALRITWKPYLGPPCTFAISGLEMLMHPKDAEMRALIRKRRDECYAPA